MNNEAALSDKVLAEQGRRENCAPSVEISASHTGTLHLRSRGKGQPKAMLAPEYFVPHTDIHTTLRRAHEGRAERRNDTKFKVVRRWLKRQKEEVDNVADECAIGQTPKPSVRKRRAK